MYPQGSDGEHGIQGPPGIRGLPGFKGHKVCSSTQTNLALGCFNKNVHTIDGLIGCITNSHHLSLIGFHAMFYSSINYCNDWYF